MQTKNNTHRAKDKLNFAKDFYAWSYEIAANAHAACQANKPHIFAPYPTELRLLERLQTISAFNDLSDNMMFEMLANANLWAAWRMTQGIYRFDESLYKELIQTDNDQDIPINILKQLPEWCVYVESPGLSTRFGDTQYDVHGAWAMFIEIGEDEDSLFIFADIDTKHADDCTLPLIQINANEQILKGGLVIDDITSEDVFNLKNWVLPIINLLLYLCADNNFQRGGRDDMPQKPQLKKTKKGMRIFPASNSTTWDVGVRVGAALRRAQAAADNNESLGGKMKGHIRRAHWHTFLSGKMKDEHGNHIDASKRKRNIKWIPPLPINIDDIDDMPAVIRKVKND